MDLRANLVANAVPTRDAETVIVENLPRIDRYFPQCLTSGIEAVSSLLFGTEHFGKLYGKHSFVYTRPPGPIGFRSNGVELDLEIHRLPCTPPFMMGEIERIYGVRPQRMDYVVFDAFWEVCFGNLERGIPTVVSFDLRYIKGRREYHTVTNPHIIVLVGYHPRRRVVVASEQTLGTIEIDWEDFVACFDHLRALVGTVTAFDISRSGRERDLERDEVLVQIETNLSNLTSDTETLGLRGLKCFVNDIGSYLRARAVSEPPFAVPGLWVFSHERHIVRKWLPAIRHLCPNADERFFGAFDELLTRLFKRWLGADFLLEKCLVAKSARSLDRLPHHLELVLPDESNACGFWEDLHRLVSTA